MDFSFENDNAFGVVEKIKPPSDYKVVLLNDDYTTKDFVVDVLRQVFHKSETEAVQIMESVHKTGSGIAGIYTYDIAHSKARITMEMARKEGFPLQCRIEKA